MVDRHELASQTSPRAAGLISHVRTTDLMCDIVRRAAAKLERFTTETGQPLDWVRPGSLKVARRPQDVPVVEGDLERGRRLGLDVELLSGDEAHSLNPLLQPDGVLAVLRVGEDLYFDPRHVAIGYVRGAQARGAKFLPHTTVTRVDIADGRVRGVETDRGTIRTSCVVDAAGAWTRQVAEASGIRIPLVPTRHQLFVTEPLDAVHDGCEPHVAGRRRVRRSLHQRRRLARRNTRRWDERTSNRPFVTKVREMPAKRTESKTSKTPAARKPAVRRKRAPTPEITVSREDIETRAYYIHLAGGHDPFENWLRAEAELATV